MAKKRSQSKAARARAQERAKPSASAPAPGHDSASQPADAPVEAPVEVPELGSGIGAAQATGDEAERASSHDASEPAPEASAVDEPRAEADSASPAPQVDDGMAEAADAAVPEAASSDTPAADGSATAGTDARPPASYLSLAQEESAFAAAHPEEGSIRGVLIQVAGGRLLLPNATIAEVLSYAQPEAIEDAPDWLLGRMRWRGWQLPMIAFSQLAGIGAERAGLGTKVVVLKALGRNGRVPYFALVTQGFPRLVTVTEQTLMLDAGDGTELPRGIQARVRLNLDDALLPDLETVEGLIGEALAQAA